MGLVARARRGVRRRSRTGLWWLHGRLHNAITVSTRQGRFRLPLRVDDPISHTLFVEGSYELETVADALSFIRGRTNVRRGSGTILDVGANNGVIGIGAVVTGEVESAVCIEPDRDNFARLATNVLLNGLKDRVATVNCAVSDRNGLLQFELSDSNYGDHRVRASDVSVAGRDEYSESSRQVVSVQARTLDDIWLNLDPRFRRTIVAVWLDVQGHDGRAFSGGQQLLSTGVHVVTEFWPYGIARAGMSEETYCDVASSLWSHYWVKRRGRFVRYPIDLLPALFDELRDDAGGFDNIILTR